MSLRQWLENGWLRLEQTSSEEISNLLSIVDRDLKDAASAVSPDWRFGIAYNAALKLCSMALRSEGYRASRGLDHYRTIMALPLIVRAVTSDDAQYLDACRIKRNTVEYDYVGAVSERDAEELILYVRELRNVVLSWLERTHPDLSSVGR